MIRDHHEGYISWAEFERNQQLIADNANGKRFMSRGAVRRGEALLPGLLRCARCGKKLRVRYGHGPIATSASGAFNQLAAARCITFGGMRVDRVLAKEVLDRLQPLGVEAALAAIEARGQQRSEKKVSSNWPYSKPAIEAARAQRQYDAADPENRLVAGELERRWNERLVAVRDLELEIDRLDADKAPALTRRRPRAASGARPGPGPSLGEPRRHAGDAQEDHSTVVSEIIVDIVGDSLELIIHWQGGDHTRLTVKRNRAGQTRWTTDAEVVDLVRALARQMPDQTIAAVLNRSGKSTGRGNSWTRGRICSLRHQYDIAIYRDGERADRGEATLEEAATVLALSPIHHPPSHRRGHSSGDATSAKARPGSFAELISTEKRYAARPIRGGRDVRRPTSDSKIYSILSIA